MVALAREPAHRLLGLAAVAMMTVVPAACTGQSIAATPTPLPASPTITPQDPSTAALQKDDLPSALIACPVSGEIIRYVQVLRTTGSPSYQVTSNQWASSRELGARAGWVSSFTQVPADCDARLGETKSPSAVSFTIRFQTPGAASDAFRMGFLGLRPAPGISLPGLVQGEGTLLGANSWVYDQTTQSTSVWTAYWAKHEFVLFLFTEKLTSAAARRAATGMNDRVH